MSNQAPSTQIAKSVLTSSDRVKTVVYRGKKIFQIDFSNALLPDVQKIIEVAKKQIESYMPKSVLIFTDLTNTAAEPHVVQALRDFAKGNATYAKASVTVGLGGAKRLVLDAINKFSGRNIKNFDNPLTAKNWLVNQ